MVTRAVGGISKEIFIFFSTSFLPVLTNVQHLGKISLLLSLHAVRQQEGRENLPSHSLQLETGNDKWVLDPPSIPQNLSPNYIKKHAQQVQQSKNVPRRSSETTGYASKSSQRVEGSSDLDFWRRTVLSLPPVAGTAAGPVMQFSEKLGFWNSTIGWKCWIHLFFINIRFYPASLQRKFWKYKLIKALQKKQFIYHFFSQPQFL